MFCKAVIVHFFGEYTGKITHWLKARYKTFCKDNNVHYLTTIFLGILKFNYVAYVGYIGFISYVTGCFLFWEPSWELFSVNKLELHSAILTSVNSTLAKTIDRIFQEMSPSVNPKSNAFSEG